MKKSHFFLFSFVLLSLYGCVLSYNRSSKKAAVVTPSHTAQPASILETEEYSTSPLVDESHNISFGQISRTTIESQGVVYDLDWSPDGTILASTSYGGARLWDPSKGSFIEEIFIGDGVVWDIEWSPHGDRLTISGDTNSSSVWDREDGQFMPIPAQLTIKSASWSTDSARLGVGLVVKRFEVYDMEDQSLDLSGRTIHGVWGIDWSPDGQMIATAEFDGYIKVWDADTGDLLRTYHGGWMGTNANNVAWSPDGKWLASTHVDGRLRLWALESEVSTPSHVFVRQPGWARGLAWSPDGSMIVSTHGLGQRDEYFEEPDAGKSGGAVYLWDVESGELLIALEEDSPTPIWSAAWSPCGKYIALGSGVYNDFDAEYQIILYALP